MYGRARSPVNVAQWKIPLSQGRALKGGEKPEESSEHKDRAKNTEARERIGAWMKDLGHTSSRCTMRQMGKRDLPWKDKGITTHAKQYCRAVYHPPEACHVKNPPSSGFGSCPLID